MGEKIEVKIEKPRDGVFLSYKSQDYDLVKQFHDALHLRGVKRIWMDKNKLTAGHEWKKKILEAIESRTHMLVFVNEKSLGSAEVREEYEYADKLGNTIIPIMIDDTMDDGALPFPLNKHQTLRLRNPHPKKLNPDNLNRTIADLLSAEKPVPTNDVTLPQMVHVPAGPFMMGIDKHEVMLPEFWIGQCAVTTHDFLQFVQDGGLEKHDYWHPELRDDIDKYDHKKYWPENDFTYYALNNACYPMHGVTWHQALAYCQWLNFRYGVDWFRLPDEAEWEKAARGTDGRIYPWGNQWQDGAANIKEYGANSVIDCGTLAEGFNSPFGCKDMAGNVWEWTLSKPTARSYKLDTPRNVIADPMSPRVIRGGSWLSERSDTRTYEKVSARPIPKNYCYEIGFRVLSTEDPSSLE
ncbi:SUMF1/EgtB/PvdO family nonheme iron enzyme [Chloroflexota bacterium]